jgi:hypothetical protein
MPNAQCSVKISICGWWGHQPQRYCEQEQRSKAQQDLIVLITYSIEKEIFVYNSLYLQYFF